MNFKEEISKALIGYVEVEVAFKLLEVPPKDLGDFAFPCFTLAKQLKKSPIEIAKKITEELGRNKPEFLEKIEAKGPYVNFFISKSDLSSQVLKNIFSEKNFDFKKLNKKVMVEYSSPNTNKPLHLGHLRNNSLGLAIANLLEITGHKVMKANLINDRGVHIGKSMLAYQKFAKEMTPEKKKIKSDHFVGEMYVKYSQEAKKNPKLEEEAQELLKKWEEGDKETIALWKKMNKWALDGMKETYKDFGTKFDKWFFESEMFEKEKKNKNKIIEEGLKKGIFEKEDNGAIVAKLEPELPNKILLRGDGTSLYATNEIILTEAKFRDFNLDEAIWVVANEQDLYFQQLFKIFEKLGRKWAKQCYHLSYGYVSLTSGRMKSREGTVVDADDLIKEVKEIALKEINQRYPKLSKKESTERARIIALGAIKFFLLKNDSKKDMIFDPQQSISFEGETAPYLQYTYARAKSILRKAKSEKIKFEKKNFDLLQEEKEKALLVELGRIRESIEKSWEQLSLHPLAHNLLGVAEKFNSFYHDVQILNEENKENKKLLNARLSLVEATAITLKKGLEILDVEVMEEM